MPLLFPGELTLEPGNFHLESFDFDIKNLKSEKSIAAAELDELRVINIFLGVTEVGVEKQRIVP